jgi:cupin fold WbuC family metalloprotein
LVKINGKFLRRLIDIARSAPRRRRHYNLHDSHDDLVQKLFNVILQGSYIRPHKHAVCNKDEFILVVSGSLALITFDDSGNVTKVVKLERDQMASCLAVIIPPDTWHTVISLSDHAVIFEVKEGPFRAENAKEFAPWAPEEGSDDVPTYLDWLLRCSIP